MGSECCSADTHLSTVLTLPHLYLQADVSPLMDDRPLKTTRTMTFVVPPVVRLEMPAGVTHQLVRQYLLHFGYAGTLGAFDDAAGLLPDGGGAPPDR